MSVSIPTIWESPKTRAIILFERSRGVKMKTAILVDGGFYRIKSSKYFGNKQACQRADELFAYCLKHLQDNHEKRELYRIFYYDCPPMDKKVYHPLLQRNIDFKTSDLYTWMTAFLNELKKKRKVALRLGRLADSQAHYTIKKEVLKNLFDKTIELSDLSEHDFAVAVDQKGVDMRIGLDIASMAYKKQVDQIVLISGDSDFVPAAKLARREGIDIILDNMGSSISDDLFEHIDGIKSYYKDFN